MCVPLRAVRPRQHRRLQARAHVRNPRPLPELDPAAETVDICHHSARSAFVTQVLGRSGFAAVYNLEGGLDAYSFVDGSVPRY